MIPHGLAVTGELHVELIHVGKSRGGVGHILLVIRLETAGDPLVPACDHENEGLIRRNILIDQVVGGTELGGEAKSLSGTLHRGKLHVSQTVVRLTTVHKATALTHGGVMAHSQGKGLIHALSVASPTAVSHLCNTADRIGVVEIFLQPCPIVVGIRPRPASAHGKLSVHLLFGIAG